MAQTRVVALEISKQDFFGKLPKDYLLYLKDMCLKKLDWVINRMKDITVTSH